MNSVIASILTEILLLVHLLAPSTITCQKTSNQLSKPINFHPSNYNSNFTHSNRPIDRPNLPSMKNASMGQFESAAEWLMLGAGDLSTDESKAMSSYSSDAARNKTKPSRRKSNRTSSYDDEQSESADSQEIFDDVEENAASAGAQKEPECAAHGRYYCTYKEDYPLKLVTEVTKYYKWPLEKLFRDLHAQIMPKLAQDSTGNLVCDSITRVVRPGWARNTNDRWLVVINTDNYHQYVTEVVCQYGTNSRCNFIPPCYYSSCQQRYNTQKLLVIDPSNPYRGPFLSEFLFPSCCVCYVPSASDTFQDKYRSSPATIYQRTLQQEASSNLHPPQFKPAGFPDELLASQPAPSAAGSVNSAARQPQGTNQAAAPGEIRRGGDQYKVARQQNELANFPSLGLVDSLIDQRTGRDPDGRH